MQLSLQSKIESELLRIIQEAILSGQIAPQLLRMIILSPDSSLERLHVCTSNNWGNYFYKDDASIIGEINISEWLDVADAALENQHTLDASYIARAKEIDKKYASTPPAIAFKHLEILEDTYVAFLTCLKEDLLLQIETALSNVATSFSQRDFEQVVGFFTHNLTYKLDGDVLLHAFNHPTGKAPFYKVQLTLPEHRHSKHYLKFHKSSIQLFCVRGTLLGANNEESEVCSYDISDISFIYSDGKTIHFRLNDEFQNWTLASDGAEIEKGDKSEQEFLDSFAQFLLRFPDKVFNPEHIPNPITDEALFQKWLNVILEYNIKVTLKHLTTIFNYGEEAFRYYLQLIPETATQYEPALKFLAGRLFYLKRFQASVDLFNSAKKLADYEKVLCLSALFCLHQRTEYDAYLSSAELESERKTLELLDILSLLREPLALEKLEDIEAQLVPLLATNKNNSTLRLLSLVLTKVYVALNNKEKALLHLQSVPTFETYEQVLLLEEFRDVDYVMQRYDQLVQKAKAKIEFEKYAGTHSLNTSKKKKIDGKKTHYDQSYYVTHKIGFSGCKWVQPLGAEIFVATRQGSEHDLILAKITADKTVEILQSIQLPDTRKTESCAYQNGILYMADAEHGIVTYKVSAHSIEPSAVVYKNKNAKANYRNLTLADGYLFASNNDYLEIYDLANPDAEVLSDSLYINSGYHLFVHNNLLVIGAGAGLLILADVTDKQNPVCSATIEEDLTPDHMHVAFIDGYMISRSLYDIRNPTAPKWISYVGDDLAPTHYFTTKPKVPVISTGEEFLFTTLIFENGLPVYTNWLESLNADNYIYERALHNLATAYFDKRLITYSRHEIVLWEKDSSPTIEKIDVHEEVETMVKNCFEFILDQHPTFSIGKVVLQQDPVFQHIDIAFHASSSLAVLIDSTAPHHLPIISSTFLLYGYCEEVFEKQYDPVKTKFEYDGDTIIQKLIHDRRFEQMAARHVLVLADSEASYLNFSNKPWQPFRSDVIERESEATIQEIILSEDKKLLNQLPGQLANNIDLLNKLLGILNANVYGPRIDDQWNNGTSHPKEFLEIRREHLEIVDNAAYYTAEAEEADEQDEEDIYCTPEYIVDPYCAPEAEIKNKDHLIPSGFLPNTTETHKLKHTAFEVLCSLSDKTLLRNILLNGMKFGYLHYSLKDIPTYIFYDQKLILNFVNNNFGLWEKFGNDAEIKLFLLSILNYLENPALEVRIAYKCGAYSHPSIAAHVERLIDAGINYYTYKGHFTGIDLSTLPAEVFKPFETLLLERLQAFEYTNDSLQRIEAEQHIVYVYTLLNKLGHKRMPAMVSKILEQAVKTHEQYGPMREDDEEYDEETAFLVNLYREAKVSRLLEYYKNNHGALWPLEEPLESFDESWNQTIQALLDQGTADFGESFKTNYVNRLLAHVEREELYVNDRVLAYELIQCTFRRIQEKPAMASLVEPLILAVNKNKEVFPKNLDVTALKNNSKYTLLQAAWNDLKNQDYDLAEQKADAVLVMDPAMGQVWVVKARLLWLKEGISAYLDQRHSFIEKASHDPIAVAALNNLSGCALDVEKRYEEALSCFQKAALAVPNNWTYIANVAEIFYKLRKASEALTHAKTAFANGNKGEILTEIIRNNGILP